jgi:hypothetical protein
MRSQDRVLQLTNVEALEVRGVRQNLRDYGAARL